MSDAAFEAGQEVRLKHDPGRVGVATGRTRELGGVRRWQVRFPGGPQYVPADQLEAIGVGGDDSLDLLERGRLGDSGDLRRAVTHARLTGRLADVIYCMDTTGTDFYAHQFKPVVKLMNSGSRGILIADEVGLGKTIEAGLLWTELRTRFDFRRLLVLCPAVLRGKWQRELRLRFGVDADILGAEDTLERLRQVRGDGGGPGFAIVASLQGLRPDRRWDDPGEEPERAASRLARFLDHHSEEEPLVDVCVIDEAHYLRNRGTMTSLLGRLVRAVSEYIVLLSATPIHLKSGDLFELLRLVDEHTFDRQQAFDDILEANGPLVRARQLILDGGGRPSAETRGGMERTLRGALAHPLLQESRQLRALIEGKVWAEDLTRPDVAARVAERLDRVNLLGHVVTRTRKREVQERRVVRDVTPQKVPLNEDEAAFYENVTNLVRDYCMRRGGHEGFLLTTPQRQMSSCMAAALQSWQQRETPDEEDEEWAETDEQDRPLRTALTFRASALGDLDALRRCDSKYRMLRGELGSLFRREPATKVVVFSYFRATLHYLRERLGEDGIRAVTLHGGHADKDEIVAGFRDRPDLHVLLSSEVGSEGIDLQFASIVVNYDLPWNPMRVEQRIGRIDRLGQAAEKIYVWNLFYKDTIDDRIHERLFRRLDIFRRALGGLEPVLGDEIRKLTRDLFSGRLTPEEEEDRIEQTALALETRQLEEERLENEAAHLAAYGDYILHQVQAARDLHRSISARDLRSYVTDFFDFHYVGSEFRQSADDPMRFDVSLSVDARHDLAAYLKGERLAERTRLVRDAVHRVPCRFENTAVPDRQGREEVISQYHPLVRFVSERLKAPGALRRPAVAITLAADAVEGALEPGCYAFSVQHWSVRGLRDMERLWYAAARVGGRTDPLAPSAAERLVVAAVGGGRGWPGARASVDLKAVVETVKDACLAPSENEFERYVQALEAENADRAGVQERVLDEHYRTQEAKLDELLAKYREQGRTRLLPATAGRLRALKARTARRRCEIDDRRGLQYSPPEYVCVGVIEVTPREG